MKTKLLFLLCAISISFSSFSQKEEKVKAKVKDYSVVVDDIAFLDATCKKYDGDPCTFSLAGSGHKAITIKSKSYIKLKKVYNQSTKTWSETPGTAYYLHIVFLNSGEEMYSTSFINGFLGTLYLANIFNEDGTIDEEKRKLFILENAEDEPRGL